MFFRGFGCKINVGRSTKTKENECNNQILYESRIDNFLSKSTFFFLSAAYTNLYMFIVLQSSQLFKSCIAVLLLFTLFYCPPPTLPLCLCSSSSSSSFCFSYHSINVCVCGISFMMTSYKREAIQETERDIERIQVICGQKLWSFD